MHATKIHPVRTSVRSVNIFSWPSLQMRTTMPWHTQVSGKGSLHSIILCSASAQHALPVCRSTWHALIAQSERFWEPFGYSISATTLAALVSYIRSPTAARVETGRFAIPLQASALRVLLLPAVLKTCRQGMCRPLCLSPITGFATQKYSKQ